GGGGEGVARANDAGGLPDLKEFFHVGSVDVTDDPYYTSPAGRRHFLPNLWPAVPEGFERAASAYYRAMSGLVVSLMRLAAIALGVGEHFFDRKVDRSIGTMRRKYYPAPPPPTQPGPPRARAPTRHRGLP